MATPSLTDEDSLIKQAEQVRRRLADFRVKGGLSPYQPLPDKIVLNYSISPYFNAVNTVLATEENNSPNLIIRKSTFRKR